MTSVPIYVITTLCTRTQLVTGYGSMHDVFVTILIKSGLQELTALVQNLVVSVASYADLHNSFVSNQTSCADSDMPVLSNAHLPHSNLCGTTTYASRPQQRCSTSGSEKLLVVEGAHAVVSASFLAEMLVRSPRKWFIFII